MVTVTRALVEVKLLDKRIKKATQNFLALKVRTKDDKWMKQFQTEVTSDIQSIQDLIKRRNELKASIILSNALTKVKIGKETYTIAEVIDMKQSIKHKKDFLEVLRHQQSLAQGAFERLNQANDAKLDKLIELNFSKEKKNNENDIASISKAFRDSNKVEIIDPVNIKLLIQSLDEEIMEFEKEADLVLSEVNAVTLI